MRKATPQSGAANDFQTGNSAFESPDTMTLCVAALIGCTFTGKYCAKWKLAHERDSLASTVPGAFVHS